MCCCCCSSLVFSLHSAVNRQKPTILLLTFVYIQLSSNLRIYIMARHGVFVLACSLIFAIGLLSGSTHAFTTNFQKGAAVSPSVSSPSKTVIFSTPPESEEGSVPDAFADPLVSDIPQVSDPAPEGTSYPIDVPSPILLASSMVLAIIGVGKQERLSSSIFQSMGNASKSNRNDEISVG